MSAESNQDKSIAENAADYDALPYLTGAMHTTQPSRLAAVAHLFGLSPKPVGQSRVLEIGCSIGGNLTPLAARYPSAEFIGIDISQVQINLGRKRVEELGLKNCSLRCISLTDMGNEFGGFDYIICHGVYSWVPPHIQSEVFRVIPERLNSDGVAQVSFNVLPGWRAWQPFRDAALAMLPDSMPINQKVPAALELLNFVVAAQRGNDSKYNVGLRELADNLKRHHSYYIGHEHLEDANNPCTFKDFVSRAEAGGLAYLGDSNISNMMPQNLKPQVMDDLLRRTGGNLLAMEQMLDILTGRTFRNALLIHKEDAPKVKRDLDLTRFDSLHFAATADVTYRHLGNAVVLDLGQAKQARIDSPASILAVKKVFDARPGSVSMASLLEGQPNAMEIRKTFAELALADAVTIFFEPLPAAARCPEKPKAFWLAQQDAVAHYMHTATLAHQRFELTPLSNFLLARMDGTKTVAELKAALAAELMTGRLSFTADRKKKVNALNMANESQDFATELLDALVARALIERPT